MSKYLLAEMNAYNSFIVNTDLSLFGTNYKNIPFKLDTGCTHSTIPYHRLKNDDFICRYHKEKDIKSGLDYMVSYGVESGGLKHKEPVTVNEKIDCQALKFKHTVANLNLAGYSLPDLDMYVNYDRHGNILIGMDILSQFDIHIGVSQKTNKVTLIGVLKIQEDKSDYENALLEHFSLVKKYSALADGIRSLFSRNRRIIKE